MNVKLFLSQVGSINIGNFEFTSRRGLEVLGDVYDRLVVDVDAGYGEIRLRIGWLFFDGNSLPLAGSKLNDSITSRISHDIREDDGAPPLKDWTAREENGHRQRRYCRQA